jgi:hypothetical protein
MLRSIMRRECESGGRAVALLLALSVYTPCTQMVAIWRIWIIWLFTEPVSYTFFVGTEGTRSGKTDGSKPNNINYLLFSKLSMYT